MTLASMYFFKIGVSSVIQQASSDFILFYLTFGNLLLYFGISPFAINIVYEKKNMFTKILGAFALFFLIAMGTILFVNYYYYKDHFLLKIIFSQEKWFISYNYITLFIYWSLILTIALIFLYIINRPQESFINHVWQKIIIDLFSLGFISVNTYVIIHYGFLIVPWNILFINILFLYCLVFLLFLDAFFYPSYHLIGELNIKQLFRMGFIGYTINVFTDKGPQVYYSSEPFTYISHIPNHIFQKLAVFSLAFSGDSNFKRNRFLLLPLELNQEKIKYNIIIFYFDSPSSIIPDMKDKRFHSLASSLLIFLPTTIIFNFYKVYRLQSYINLLPQIVESPAESYDIIESLLNELFQKWC